MKFREEDEFYNILVCFLLLVMASTIGVACCVRYSKKQLRLNKKQTPRTTDIHQIAPNITKSTLEKTPQIQPSLIEYRFELVTISQYIDFLNLEENEQYRDGKIPSIKGEVLFFRPVPELIFFDVNEKKWKTEYPKKPMRMVTKTGARFYAEHYGYKWKWGRIHENGQVKESINVLSKHYVSFRFGFAVEVAKK